MTQVGRNDPCPCGSGKKYKKCCLAKDTESSRSTWRSAWSYAERSHLIKSSQDYPTERCLINSDWEEGGLARIVVTRRQDNGKYILGVYLVDTYCLGVKNAFCNAELTMNEINEKCISRCFGGGQPDDISLEKARAIVFGGVEYARGLGFEPHPDFKLASYVLGIEEGEGDYDIRFGGPEGKPLYIAGPDDNHEAVIQKLSSRLGEGGFHYMLPVRGEESWIEEKLNEG